MELIVFCKSAGSVNYILATHSFGIYENLVKFVEVYFSYMQIIWTITNNQLFETVLS